jgi:hypothetical protein
LSETPSADTSAVVAKRVVAATIAVESFIIAPLVCAPFDNRPRAASFLSDASKIKAPMGGTKFVAAQLRQQSAA